MAVLLGKKVDLSKIEPATPATLGELDYVIGVDISPSMGRDSLRAKGRFGFGKKNRLQEVEADVVRVAQLAEKYDDDGLTVISFSDRVTSEDGVTSNRVSQVFKKVDLSRGSTNLAGAIRALLLKVESSSKQVVGIFYTDGVPDDEHAVFALLNEAAKKYGRPKLNIVFIQVGEDPSAYDFLDRLNGGLENDICAAVSAEEAEKLTIEQLVTIARTK